MVASKSKSESDIISLTAKIDLLNDFETKIRAVFGSNIDSDKQLESTLLLLLHEFGKNSSSTIDFSFVFKLSQYTSLSRTQSDIRVDLNCRECRITIGPESLRWGFNPLLYGRVGTIIFLINSLVQYNENIVASFMVDSSDGLSPLVVWNGHPYDYPFIAYSSYREDSCLVADPFFMRSGGYAEHRHASLATLPSWSERESLAVWRGAAHGHRLYRESPAKLAPAWAWHQRLHLCAISKLPNMAALMNVGITSYDTLPEGELRDELDRLHFKAAPIVKSDFANYKYIIDVDGYSNSWPGLFTALLTGSCVLKIESAFGFKQWYYDRLVPWKNFVPVSETLEDLPERLDWVNANEHLARQIGEAGRRLALSMSLDMEIHRSIVGISEWLVKRPSHVDYEGKPGEYVPHPYALAGATTVEKAVITAFYRKLLGREPDEAGLQGGIQSLRNMGLSQGIEVVINNVLNCDEFLARQGRVE